MSELNHSNQFVVCGSRRTVRITQPPHRGEPLTAEQALNLAAWLVAIADPECRTFPRLLHLVHDNEVTEAAIQAALGMKL